VLGPNKLPVTGAPELPRYDVSWVVDHGGVDDRRRALPPHSSGTFIPSPFMIRYSRFRSIPSSFAALE
jgi:hypothetical protein